MVSGGGTSLPVWPSDAARICLQPWAPSADLRGMPKVKTSGFAANMRPMASVNDVAAYILREAGPMDTWKLQKLVYYCQAWHLVWEDEPLFAARIEAWANGPVAPELYRQHRGQYKVEKWPSGRISNLTRAERESIEVVLRYYGKFTGYALREQTHNEPPWRAARAGLEPGERGNNVITVGSLAQYYGSL